MGICNAAVAAEENKVYSLYCNKAKAINALQL
jgi:hypothetical protein